MAQWFRKLAALTADIFTPSTHVGQLLTPVTLSPRDDLTSFSGLHRCAH